MTIFLFQHFHLRFKRNLPSCMWGCMLVFLALGGCRWGLLRPSWATQWNPGETDGQRIQTICFPWSRFETLRWASFLFCFVLTQYLLKLDHSYTGIVARENPLQEAFWTTPWDDIDESQTWGSAKESQQLRMILCDSFHIKLRLNHVVGDWEEFGEPRVAMYIFLTSNAPRCSLITWSFLTCTSYFW